MNPSGYDKWPAFQIEGEVTSGWDAICDKLKSHPVTGPGVKTIIVFELYAGADFREIRNGVDGLSPALVVDARDAMLSPEKIDRLTFPFIGNDELFGCLSTLRMADFFDTRAIASARRQVNDVREGIVVVMGQGAALVAGEYDLLVYADMARWEIQKRMKRGEAGGLGIDERHLRFSRQYKRGYFVDWRVCDRFKKELFPSMNYILDTNRRGEPKLVPAEVMFGALKQLSLQPFRVVPYFDPGPWGGQWMREVCGLDSSAPNYAWCFDCVPEENSLLLDVSGTLVEIPAINLVFCESGNLLGTLVEARFGQEFPIRFDLLDTMKGGNLSLQVHPDAAYIASHFGMPYTQDESYYLLDAGEDASVFLGLKTGVDPEAMTAALTKAQNGGGSFDEAPFVNRFPARKHDHFLIPAGTVHCSGANAMVLEISATPFIFTFKMWDWNRLGLDGRPRPININHASGVIRWERDTTYAETELINPIEPVASGDGWREERTGLHPSGFIETRRHWFSVKVLHQTHNSVNVLNLVEGGEAVVESPGGMFEPFTIHYAETFIIPAAVKEYSISPSGLWEGKEIATIKAFVRV
ncbi:MAG: class I mannose-6-phosphate isomerase [Bacteroidota bacterium]